MRMAGRVALVTGSTSGIGRGVAERYAAEGASVVVTGRRSELGEEVVAGIEARGGRSRYVRADLTDLAQCEALVAETMDHFGGLDTLVNNAADPGGARDKDGPLHTTDPEFWDATYRSNVRSVLAVTKAALDGIRRSGRGRIINVSSVMAVQGGGWDTYAWAKSSLRGLTKSMAYAYAADGVTVNCLIVGSVVVERTAGNWESPEAEARWRGNGLTRIGRPEDIAHACVYLGSDEAAYVTGAELAVDGGMTARGLSSDMGRTAAPLAHR